MSKIVNFNGTLVDLSRLKAIKINEFYDIKPASNILTFELDKKSEYIFNPNEKNWELRKTENNILVEYPNGDEAVEAFKEAKNIWGEYKNTCGN